MTNLQNDGRRYYVCSQHRKRGKCEHVRFHRLFETKERVEQFVLSLLEDPDVLREKVQEQADRERSRFGSAGVGSLSAELRQELAGLQTERDEHISRAARVASITDRDFDRQLWALDVRRVTLEGKLAELASSDKHVEYLEKLPGLVDEYLRDLPYLVGREWTVREYETVSPERTEDNPFGIHTLTPESIRHFPEEELTEKRRIAEEERSQRFRNLYEALNLHVVCHKDRSLEVTWGGGQCSVLRGRE